MARPQLNVTTLDFFTGEAGAFIIDIPRALSLYNRKSYRSGYVYSVDYIEYIGSTNDVISIAKLPETYVTLSAYKLGFEMWKAQRAAAIDESGIGPGRWSDFKPWYNQDHQTGVTPEMSPRGVGGGVILQPLDLTGAEWNRAEVQVNDIGAATTDVVNVGMLGDNDLLNDYGGLIEAYGNTRTATLSPDPLTPNVASQSWITRTGEASAEMSQDVIDLIETENDQPPYANQADVALAATYLGNSQSATHGTLVDTTVTGSTGRGVSLNGGLFPLGMMLVAIASVGTSSVIRVHLTRGEYKGVAALPMGDFS